MNIEILGSGSEVGKSAILVGNDKTKIILDYGVKLQPEPPKYPPIRKSDAVILSHAHLDHSGAIPVLYRKWKNPVYMNDVTLDMSIMLLLDSIKVGRKQGYRTPYTKNDVKRMIKNTKLVNYYENFSIGSFNCSLYDAGHIPGSSGILLDGGKKIFYTGDIQTRESNLLNKCVLPKKIDVLITESTYSEKKHPKRSEEESGFIKSIEEVLALEEKAIVPVFAIGRSQEILLILEKYASKVALDGMAKKASDIISYYGRYLKDAKRLKRILKKVFWVRSREDRTRALKNCSIFVSSAGMLGGGPAIYYLNELKRREESRVLFSGFLVEDSPGWNLIKTSVFQNEEEKFNVSCRLEQFELSAHTDRDGLFDIIRKTSPEKVICVHGEKTKKFAKDIRSEFNIEAVGPSNGEVIKL